MVAALDPALRALIDADPNPKPEAGTTVAETRAGIDRMRLDLPPGPDLARVENVTIERSGGTIPARLYRPRETPDLPVIVYFHGGGWVIGTLDTHDGLVRHLARDSDAVVLSVGYRLAPEHVFPAALEDCLAAVHWAAEHLTATGGGPARLLLAGDSAGGNLAAATALRLRDEGGPAPVGQLLYYPATDHYSAGFPSYQHYAVAYGLTREGMVWFWDHYLDGPTRTPHPHAAPLRAPSLAGLPPTLVMTAEYDVLKDEGLAYAAALRRAGVPTRLKHYESLCHGCLHWLDSIAAVRAAHRDCVAWARSVLAAPR